MSFVELIKPELLILVPFLYGVGYLVSRIPKAKDWMVNIAISVISIGVTTGYMYAFMPEGKAIQTAILALLQGVIIAMATITSERVLEKIITNKSSGIFNSKIDEAPKADDQSVTVDEKTIEDFIDEVAKESENEIEEAATKIRK